jgi:hypothetical protein
MILCSGSQTTIKMAIIRQCAWCGSFMGVKEGDLPSTLSITHSICPTCTGIIKAGTQAAIARWDGKERRCGLDRRSGQRRAATRDVAETLIVLRGIAWIDSTGTDRRRGIRRQEDFKMVVTAILQNAFK